MTATGLRQRLCSACTEWEHDNVSHVDFFSQLYPYEGSFGDGRCMATVMQCFDDLCRGHDAAGGDGYTVGVDHAEQSRCRVYMCRHSSQLLAAADMLASGCEAL
eukprot:10757170-Ditylum_brightwellii.AAC.2